MPADYLAVRDSCYKSTKEKTGTLSDDQKSSCKKKASIWYFKKHGKPVPKESKSSYTFIINENTEDFYKKNLDLIIKDDCIDELEEKDNKLFATIVLAESDILIFTQPFSKEEAEYKKYEDIPNLNVDNPNQDLPNTEVNKIDFCHSCAHFVFNQFGPPIMGYGDSQFEKHLCHLVRGLIDDFGTCKYHKDALIEHPEDNKSSARRITNKRENEIEENK